MTKQKQEQYSKIINSVDFSQMINNDLDYVKDMLRGFCEYKKYTGELLNTYNKTYQLNNEGLKIYLFLNLPKKYMIEFYNFIKERELTS